MAIKITKLRGPETTRITKMTDDETRVFNLEYDHAIMEGMNHTQANYHASQRVGRMRVPVRQLTLEEAGHSYVYRELHKRQMKDSRYLKDQ